MNEEPLESPGNNDTALKAAKEKTRHHFRNLWEIISRYSRFDELTATDKPKHPAPKRHQLKNSFLLKLLSILPYLLITLFVISFFWDFNGIYLTLWSRPLEFQGILKIISVSGLIGYGTNWLAITMLFKPARKRPIMGHGLIPAQKDRIAYRLAQAVSDDLINPEIIKQKISESDIISRYREQSTDYIKGIIDDPNFREDLKRWMVIYVDEMIADPAIRTALAERILIQIKEALHEKSFEKAALKAYSFVKGQQMQEIIEEALVQIPPSVENGLNKLDSLMDQLPSKIDEHSEALEDIVTTLLYKLVNQLDVNSLVEENLNSYDEQQLSGIIRGATNEQLHFIQYLGAFLGMIGGFVIWEPLLSTLFLFSLTLLILSIDIFLMKIE